MERFPVLRRKANAQASTLSGGEQKMLEIARGLMLEPKLMLIDEPSIGLSPILVEELFGLLRDMRARGITVLMIEQNAKRALDNSDYGIVLELGRTRIQDRAATILADPRIGQLFLGGGLEPVAGDAPPPPSSPYVASVGERTMNAVASRNIKFVSHSDLGGRGDGVQIMVHRGYAYVGHGFSNGITTVDVRDAKNPKVVDFIACPPGTRAFHLQTHDDLLLAVNAPSVWTMQEFQNEKAYFGGSPADKLKDQSRFTSGIRVYDISKPEKPAEIGFMPVEGLGPHRIWYTGGRYAYASIHFADFTDHIFAVIDMSDPRKPQVVGRWWLPGMWRAGGETPTWRDGQALRAAPRPRRRQPRLCRLARRRADRARRRRSGQAQARRPSQHRPAVRRRHALAAAAAGPQPPRPRRRADVGQLQRGAALHLDVRHARAEQSGQHRDLPAALGGGLLRQGRQLRPAQSAREPAGRVPKLALIFATYYNAGVRAYDISNQFQPREVGFYVPPNPARMMDPRPNRPQVIQSCDCYVDRNGLMYLTDPNAGLNILQFEGELAS